MLLNYDHWENQLSTLAARYQNASPFPHIVLDNFLESRAADSIFEEFPPIKDERWNYYAHYNEKKYGLNKKDLLPTHSRSSIDEMSSERFLKFLSNLTGIQNLLPDDGLEGGGLHQSPRGGFLNIHADYTVHPRKPKWKRRLNLLIYFNKDWKDEYRGELELWSRDMKTCKEKIFPVYNRCVIFNTDDDSFHGLPEPIQCPENMTRKSIALYYFTEEKAPLKGKATNYRSRPQDGVNSAFIYIDKKAVAVFNYLKGKTGLSDSTISKFFKFISPRQNRR